MFTKYLSPRAGLLLALGLFSATTIVSASGDYNVLEGYPMGRCRLASTEKTKNPQALPRDQLCRVSVSFFYTGWAMHRELTPPIAYYPYFKGVTYWIEFRDPRAKRWTRISSRHQLLRNGETKQLMFKPKGTGRYRVAFDSYNQIFADEYAETFSLLLK